MKAKMNPSKAKISPSAPTENNAFYYQAVIFDMDGTIVDTDLMIILSYWDMYRKFRPGYKPAAKKLLSFSGPALEDVIKQEFPDTPYEEAYAYFQKVCPKYYDETVYAYPGLKEVLIELKKEGIKTAVVTSKYRSAALYTLKLTGLEGLFDLVIAGDDVTAVKPDPEGVFKAMCDLKLDNKNKILYIGDTVYDYETAKNAGVRCMLVTWTPRALPRDLKPRYFLDAWTDFFSEVLHG